MIHPVQRICCSETHLYYATGQTISAYHIASGESTTLWTAAPISKVERAKNLEHRAVIAIVVQGDHLVWISEDKTLRVLQLATHQVLSEREMAKRGCALFVDGDVIVVGDKFGDVYHYPLLVQADASSVSNKKEEETAPGKGEEQLPIVGHVSMLTSVLLTRPAASTSNSGGDNRDNKRFIISADRDEHIRISNFPDGHNIQQYCLGHTQFISALLLPTCLSGDNESDTTLLSAGGDEYLAFWDIATGRRTRTMGLHRAVALAHSEGLGFAVLKLLEVPQRRMVAVLVEGVKRVFLYPLASHTPPSSSQPSLPRPDNQTETPMTTVANWNEVETMEDELVVEFDLSLPAVDMAISGSTLFVSLDTSTTTSSTIPDAEQQHIVNFECFPLNDEGAGDAYGDDTKGQDRRKVDVEALNASSRTVVQTPVWTSHKADLMRKRSKQELESIRLERKREHGKVREGQQDPEENGEEEEAQQEQPVDEELQKAIEADKITTERLNKKVKLS